MFYITAPGFDLKSLILNSGFFENIKNNSGDPNIKKGLQVNHNSLINRSFIKIPHHNPYRKDDRDKGHSL